MAVDHWSLVDTSWHAVADEDGGQSLCGLDLTEQDVLDERETPVRRNSCQQCLDRMRG